MTQSRERSLAKPKAALERGSARIDLLLALGFTLIAALLVLPNLGGRALWEDEAETALIARNILHTGLPMAWDGRLLITQLGGHDLTDSMLSSYVPWAARYVAAAGMALSGDDAWGARLPFALLGCLSLGLGYLLALRLSADRWLACFATILLASSVQYLLLARQCRYYMLVMAAAVVALWVYQSLSSRRDVLILSLALAVMFHSNYGSFACFGGGMLLHAVLMRRDSATFRRLAAAALGVGLLTTPWFFGLDVLTQVINTPTGRPPLLREFILTTFVINQYVLPWLVALALAVAAARWKLRFPQIYALAACMIGAAALGLPLLLWANPRYLPYLLLLGSITMAGVAREVHLRHRVAGYAVASLFFLSTLPAALGQTLLPGSFGTGYLRGGYSTGTSALGSSVLRAEWREYVRELRQEFVGPDEAIAAFLNEHANEDDFVYATLNRLPIMFHTRRRVVDLLSRDMRERPGWDRLPSYLWTFRDADWLILRRTGPDGQLARRDLEILRRLRSSGYSSVRHDLPVRDVGWANRPMQNVHNFTSPLPETGKNLVIFSLTLGK